MFLYIIGWKYYPRGQNYLIIQFMQTPKIYKGIKIICYKGIKVSGYKGIKVMISIVLHILGWNKVFYMQAKLSDAGGYEMKRFVRWAN